MVDVSKTQRDPRRSVSVLIAVITLNLLFFGGCTKPEPETVEFQPSGANWEMSEISHERRSRADSRFTRPSNPTLEAIGETFSGF